MSVVSNASPLINLARIGQLALLQRLYKELLIPEAVWQEVVVQGAGQAGADQVERAAWIRVKPIENRAMYRLLQQELDAGEAEAIVLAQETGAEFLLMDESLGRQTAQYLGIRCVGLIGVLIEAKHKGLIPDIKFPLNALRDVAGFRKHQALYLRILQDEGEYPREDV